MRDTNKETAGFRLRKHLEVHRSEPKPISGLGSLLRESIVPRERNRRIRVRGKAFVTL